MSYNEDTQMYEGFIYCIENLVNHHKYIGQTRQKNITMRWYDHKDASRTKEYPLYKAIRKYGIENFQIYQIDYVECVEKEDLVNKLNELEIFYIAKYNTYKGEGYNADRGGNCHADYLCEPIDAYLLDGTFLRTFDSCNEADQYYGLYSGAASKVANGKQNRSKEYTFRHHGEPFDKYDPFSYDRSSKVYQFLLSGELIHVYSNITLAEKATGIHHMNIHHAIITNGTSGGFVWQHTPNFVFNIDGYRNRIPIDQYKMNGEFVRTYSSMSDACASIGKPPVYTSGLKRCCDGKREYAYGYVWRYSGEPFNKYPVRTSQEQANMYRNRKPVDKYSLDGEFLGTYKSYSDACVSIGKDSTWVSHIRNTCNGKKKFALGYVWRNHGDPFDYDELMNVLAERNNTKLQEAI